MSQGSQAFALETAEVALCASCRRGRRGRISSEPASRHLLLSQGSQAFAQVVAGVAGVELVESQPAALVTGISGICSSCRRGRRGRISSEPASRRMHAKSNTMHMYVVGAYSAKKCDHYLCRRCSAKNVTIIFVGFGLHWLAGAS